MNIAVQTYSGACIARPDTTKSKVAEDIFLPEFVKELTIVPVLYANVCRAGRSVGAKFAHRYFDTVSYGILLYPENLIKESEAGFAVASCLDHTTYIPLDFIKPEEQEEFVLKSDEKELFRTGPTTIETIQNAIENVTKYIYIRTGDLVAIELGKRIKLCKAGENVRVTGLMNNKETIDINITI